MSSVGSMPGRCTTTCIPVVLGFDLWGGVFLALNVFFIGKHLIEDRVSSLGGV